MSEMADFWPKIPPPGTGELDIKAAADPQTHSAGPKAPKTPKPPEKTYVHVPPIDVGTTFDDKYKTSVPPTLNAGIAAAINASPKLTTTEQPKGFYLDGNLALTRKGINLFGKLTMQIADWPQKALILMLTPSSGTEVRREAKIDDDVTFVVGELLKEIAAKVIPEIEKRAP